MGLQMECLVGPKASTRERMKVRNTKRYKVYEMRMVIKDALTSIMSVTKCLAHIVSRNSPRATDCTLL